MGKEVLRWWSGEGKRNAEDARRREGGEKEWLSSSLTTHLHSAPPHLLTTSCVLSVHQTV